MVCSPAGFSTEIFSAQIFPYAQCSPPYYQAGCIKPGSTLELYVQVLNISAYPCKCATVAFYVNGSEIGRKEVCVNPGYTWSEYSYLEATMKYVVPAYGTYNICADVVSTR